MQSDAHVPHPDQATSSRSLLQAWAEVRGLLGGHAAAHRHLTLHTDDGIRLAATLLPGPGDASRAVVVAHGFAAHRRKPRYAWLADELATRFTVLAVDLRGHGGSGGRSGLGGTEAMDIAAAVRWLRERGHDWVAAVGASMGATSTANALARGVDLDAAVLLSGPGWIELDPTTAPMRRLRAVWHAPLGRAGLRAATGVRVDPPHDWTVPVDPAVATSGLTIPLLVVHGHDDEWFPAAHAHALVDDAHAATLWLEHRFGHAEDGFDDPFGRRLATALLAANRTGTFPTRQEVPW